MYQVFIGKMKYKIIGLIIEYYYFLWYIIEKQTRLEKKYNNKWRMELLKEKFI